MIPDHLLVMAMTDGRRRKRWWRMMVVRGVGGVRFYMNMVDTPPDFEREFGAFCGNEPNDFSLAANSFYPCH
jgi:hypothetical protein